MRQCGVKIARRNTVSDLLRGRPIWFGGDDKGHMQEARDAVSS
jgi:hypothetical protein